jgi:hypothetical protein
MRGRQRAPVFVHAVSGGIEAGEDGAVRRQGLRIRRVRLPELQSRGGDAVEGRSVRADGVGACGVERDQENRRPLYCGLLLLAAGGERDKSC